jgi:hypothetical protein
MKIFVPFKNRMENKVESPCYAPVAQLDRATDFHLVSRDRDFDIEREDLVWHFSKSRNSSKSLQTKALSAFFEFCLLPVP